jgi:hypothetical protein
VNVTRLVVGVPAFHRTGTLPETISAIQAGLSKYFPQHTASIVVCSSGDRHAAEENVIWLTKLQPSLRHILEKSEELDAAALAVIEPDPRPNTAEAIDNLFRPILHARYDLAAASYLEPRDEGAITKLILYPLTRALYGASVRFPAAGEFGLSAQLVRRLIDQIPWEGGASRPSVNLRIATSAIADDFRVCESFMGAKPASSWGSHGVDLNEVLTTAAGTVFDLMGEFERVWRRSQPTPAPEFFGYPSEARVQVLDRSPIPSPDLRKQCSNLREVWQRFLRSETLRRIMELDPEAGFADGLWTQIVFEFACAWRSQPLPRGLILDTLKPLYLAKLSSDMAETADAEPEAVEERIERLCRMFETLKPYLVARWTGEPASDMTQESTQLEVRPNG